MGVEVGGGMAQTLLDIRGALNFGGKHHSQGRHKLSATTIISGSMNF